MWERERGGRGRGGGGGGEEVEMGKVGREEEKKGGGGKESERRDEEIRETALNREIRLGRWGELLLTHSSLLLV